VLIDSDAEESFLDQQVAARAGIISKALEKPCGAPAMDGFPWQATHSPYVYWAEGKWNRCPAQVAAQNLWTCQESQRNIKEVFSKSKALSLPPHCPYDCAINLIPGSPLPSSRLYNLSHPENAAMEKYIKESLATGIIHRPSLRWGWGSSLWRKDSLLYPCIDFRGLNNNMVKNKYPLPLIDSAFTSL
ncbi:hypothetical protein L3Q82_011496, partial [Scortum barcoo]